MLSQFGKTQSSDPQSNWLDIKVIKWDKEGKGKSKFGGKNNFCCIEFEVVECQIYMFGERNMSLELKSFQLKKQTFETSTYFSALLLFKIGI